MYQSFKFMFDNTNLNNQYKGDSDWVSKHGEDIVDDSKNWMIKTGLNVFYYTEALLIKTLFPEEIENKGDKHEGSRKQVDD